jgi:thiol-disulfide isomerase/thioredoxin
MKRILLFTIILFFGFAHPSFSKESAGYHLRLTIPGVKDSVVYLAHYYGKPLPNIYKRDSAKFDRNGVAEFKSNDPEFVGGIYMMLLGDRKTYFELLLNAGDDFSVTGQLSKLPDGVKFIGSPENVRFQEYVEFLKGYGEKQQALVKELATAKNADDSAAIRKKGSESAKELTSFRNDYIKKYPKTLLCNIFMALDVPHVPEGAHILPDGVTKDSAFAYNYYKSHFWDGFNFQDDRLIHAPIIDAKLDEYFNKLVLPWPDSVEKEADVLLRKAHGTRDVFKYTLWWLTRFVENSKVMGMDEAFVYLVENYYMKGEAFWLTNDELTKYLDRAQKIAPNVIGNLAPEIKAPNVASKKEESLLGSKGNYTLLIFYSPSCGHCQHELPELDSLYRSDLKAKGVKVFTVATEGEEKAITDFLSKNKLDEWTNTWDHEHTGDWRGKYDVYSTPTIYLLDDKKIIRGKRLDHSNVGSLVDMLEKKAKKANKLKS